MQLSKRIGKILVAMAIIAAWSTLAAGPAPAVTTTLYIHAGTLDVSIDTDPEYESVTEIGGPAHTCDDPERPPSDFVVDVDGTMTAVEEVRIGSPANDGYYATFFTFGGNEYQLDQKLGDPGELGFGTNTGSISGTHPNQTVEQHLLLEGQIFTTSGCEKTGSSICHFAIELTVAGDFNSTTMHVGPLDGTGSPQLDFCNSPFASLADGVADVTGFVLDDEVPA